MKQIRPLAYFAALLWLLILPLTAAADTIYIVQPGDTLMAISRQFGISMQAIVQANNIINPNFIYVNQRLVIPTTNTPPQPPNPGNNGGSESATIHTVQSGETLSRIAVRYGVTISAIAATNRISNINFIFVGQQLAIPGVVGSPPPSPTQPPAPNPTAVPPQPTSVPQQPTPVPPQPTPVPPPPTPVPPPVTSGNLLPNGSFENGWYNMNGVAELQLPNSWRFEWDSGPTGFGSESWDVWLRPETRVLSRQFLPPSEHPLFIYDGDHTVKIFKGSGAISVRMLTDVTLEPGTYELVVNVFPDLVVGYQNGQKVLAPDPLSGDVRLIAAGGSSGWILPNFGQRNRLTYRFTINQRSTVTVGAAIRGRFAIQNNGWFVDDWSLTRVQ